VIGAPSPCALTRTDAARPAEERQKEATDAAIAEYRRLSPLATGDLLTTEARVRPGVGTARMGRLFLGWMGQSLAFRRAMAATVRGGSVRVLENWGRSRTRSAAVKAV
jgi:hypothetical protein